MPAERMHCEVYHCHMSVAACIARQKNAASSKTTMYEKPGAYDINCQKCEQGRRIVAAHDPERKKIMENRKDSEVLEQICKDKDCDLAGKTQSIDNYQIHGPSGKRLEICKACMGRRKSEGRRKKQKKTLSEHFEKGTKNTKNNPENEKAGKSGGREKNHCPAFR